MLSTLYNSSRRNIRERIPPRFKSKHLRIKRFVDAILALVLIIALSPGLLLLAAILLIVDGRPIVFRHERVGVGGKGFQCLKFRTMRRDSQERLAEILKTDEKRRLEWEQSQKFEVDPRVHWIGKLLRISSLDELPQLINVFKGEMSFVGPRPIVTAELAKYGDSAEFYLAMTPGITGLWQISGRCDTTYSERVRLDVEYFHKRSIWFDLLIILKTLPVLLYAHNGR